jgi:hypothetical protein
MKAVAYRIMLVLAVGGLAVLGCKQTAHPNHAPTITALDMPTEIDASVDATLRCTASDPDTDALAYNWTCSAGELQSTTGSAVVWTAPESAGTATITVTVRDDSGAADTMSGTVVVNSVTTTLFDWTGTINGGDYKLFSSSYIPARYTVSGSFSATPLDITFLMLDSANYQQWRLDSSYVAVVKVEKSAGSDFSAVVPAGAGYHFILDNQYNVSPDTSVHLVVQQVSP